jgi:hypothetical protein
LSPSNPLPFWFFQHGDDHHDGDDGGEGGGELSAGQAWVGLAWFCFVFLAAVVSHAALTVKSESGDDAKRKGCFSECSRRKAAAHDALAAGSPPPEGATAALHASRAAKRAYARARNKLHQASLGLAVGFAAEKALGEVRKEREGTGQKKRRQETPTPQRKAACTTARERERESAPLTIDFAPTRALES